jgi:hypothetical protein
MTARRPTIDPVYLHRTKCATPEQKLDWLAAAAEFVRARKTKHTALRDGDENTESRVILPPASGPLH